MSDMNKQIELFVPGRLCLFGEHSDWAGQMRKFNAAIDPGLALVVCTHEGIYAAVSPSDRLEIISSDNGGNKISAVYKMEIHALQKAAAEGGFFSYIAGVAAYMLNVNRIGGLRIECTSITLPQKKGLSSSAAICTLTARAFNRIYGLNLTTHGEMEAAFYGEQLTPSRCGRLDQAVAYGHGIVRMCFDGDRLDVQRIKTGAPLHFVFADLNASKDTVSILRNLNSAYPYPQTKAHGNLHKLLGTENKRIVESVMEAIAGGDTQRIGALMTEAQGLFDEYAAPLSPDELESPVLHKILSDSTIRHLTYGGKGVGSQGDGSVQFIARSSKDKDELIKYIKEELGLDCYSVTVPKTPAVRKAVVPVGGYGTRMFPATKMTKKEFFPIVDTDGLIKPLLLILLESLIESGIEEICLVIRPDEENLYRQLFESLPDLHLNKLPENLRRYNDKMVSTGDKIHFAYQNEPLGFGHAVLQSKDFANDEPVLLVLGDHLYSSKTDKTCASELIDAYENSRMLTIGLFEVPFENVSSCGIAKISDEGFELLSLVEKPSQDYARSELEKNGKYYGIFMYVLTPGVYDILATMLSDFDNIGELQLTPALDSVLKKYGAAGVAVNGTRHDIGMPELYRKTVAEYGR